MGIIHHIPSRWRLPRGWRCRCPRAPSGSTRWWWDWPLWTATLLSRAWGIRARPASACRSVQWPGAGACGRQNGARPDTAAPTPGSDKPPPQARAAGSRACRPPFYSAFPNPVPFATTPPPTPRLRSLRSSPSCGHLADPKRSRAFPSVVWAPVSLSPGFSGASQSFPKWGGPRRKR